MTPFETILLVLLFGVLALVVISIQIALAERALMRQLDQLIELLEKSENGGET